MTAVNRQQVRNVDELSRAIANASGPVALNILRGNARLFTELVRFLLDGGDARLAVGFRKYLGAIAGGAPPTVATLEHALGMELRELERSFGRRLRARSVGIGD